MAYDPTELDSHPFTTDSPAWPLLARCPLLALGARVMLLAVVGASLVWLGDALLSTESTVVVNSEAAEAVAAANAGSMSFASLAVRSSDRLVTVWWVVVEPFFTIVENDRTLAQRSLDGLRCLWRIAVWGLLAGAILRMAALGLTRNEWPDLLGGLRFAWRSRKSLVGAPLVTVAGLLVLAIPVGLARLATQFDLLAPVAAALWPVVIFASLVFAIFAIGALVGWPMLWAAVATEQSDGFDALSRVFAYVYQKPFRLVAYVGFSAAILWTAGMGVEAIATVAITASRTAHPEAAAGWSLSTMGWWEETLSRIVSVYYLSAFWMSTAAIYLLRRRDIDGTPIDDVDLSDSDIQPLPTLQSSSDGIPEVVQSSAA